MSKKNKTFLIYIGIFTGAALISIAYGFLMHTFGTYGGDSEYYVGQANEILLKGLEYYIEHIATPYYWGYPTFLAVCIAIVGENWVAIALIQVFFSAFSMIFLFRLVNDISGQSFLSFLLTLFYKLILDTSMWDGRILSDSLGMTLECMTLYFFYMGMQNKQKKDLALFIIFACLFFMARTNSISLLIVLTAEVLLTLPGRKKWAIGGIIAAAVLVGLFVAGGNENLGLGARAQNFASYYQQGEIVHGRPEYNYSIPEGHLGTPLFILDIIFMIILKFKYYWSIYFNDYSMTHIVICLVTILPVFALTLFSVIHIINDRQRQLYPFVVGIVTYCSIQICTEVDFDLRFRAPIFLLCTICSGYGMKKLYSLIRGWHKGKSKNEI